MCRRAVETRNRVARELQAREKEKKEQELRELAMRARAERGGAGAYAPPPAAARYPHTHSAPLQHLRACLIDKQQPFCGLYLLCELECNLLRTSVCGNRQHFSVAHLVAWRQCGLLQVRCCHVARCMPASSRPTKTQTLCASAASTILTLSKVLGKCDGQLQQCTQRRRLQTLLHARVKSQDWHSTIAFVYQSIA